LGRLNHHRVVRVICLFPRSGRIIDRWSRIDTETASLQTAIRHYDTEFGAIPVGDSRAVFQALRGQNPRHMVFIQFPEHRISSVGDLLDPWGTPYKIYYSGNEVLVRSAGRNKRFDDSREKDFDDYIR
jgi:hypothetical protein